MNLSVSHIGMSFEVLIRKEDREREGESRVGKKSSERGMFELQKKGESRGWIIMRKRIRKQRISG